MVSLHYKLIMIVLCGWFTTTFSCAESHHPQAFLNSIKGSKNEGEQIVEHFCSNCHAVKPLIPLGAPGMKQKADWEARIKGGLKQLVEHTENGFNAMPPRGGCFECTDKQLTLAILAMLPDEFAKELLIDRKVYKKNK
ncbi:cytochrome c5 [Legionella feeleii]|uniref:Cytochrome c5 n=2 Tax=Legionella feeleii TaxID=453 RepID=A0A0W0U1E6_9GAMM|nr:cytochrome c5 [Legionella feeleii]SPX59410.1 cytochrome c5 [Legionella feeleii]